MKANELRIGNMVNLIDRKGPVHIPMSTAFKVLQIGLFNSLILEQTLNPAQTENWPRVTNGDLSPIPITREWMIKLGFANSKPGKWEHGVMPIEIYWNERMKFYYGNAVGISLEYVHQLQNLYFALTGEELILS